MIFVACYNSVPSLENLNWLDGLASIVLGFWMDCAMKNEIVLRKITQMSHDTWFCKMISPNCPTYIASSTTCCPVSLKKQILEHWTPWHHMEWKRTINNQIKSKITIKFANFIIIKSRNPHFKSHAWRTLSNILNFFLFSPLPFTPFSTSSRPKVFD